MVKIIVERRDNMMRKIRICRIISSFLCFFTIFSFIQFSCIKKVAAKDEASKINVDAKSALLMEPVTGKILYEKNIHEKFAPASVTKIMTMLLTMEAIDSGKIKLSDKVTVSENAKKMGGSSMILDTGEVRTVEELIKGVAIASGNDAAVALAEYISGTEEAFVQKMNDRAKELAMNDTTFKNCTGLSAQGHLTTAYDIAIMSRELLKHPAILKYSGTYMETISEGRKTPIGLVNHNKLVRFFKGCDGLKTGFTEEAKYCISATAVRNGIRMLAVIMGSPDYKVRNRDASMLMNYGFSRYESQKIVVKDTNIEKVYFDKRADKYFIAKAGADLSLVIERGTNSKIEKRCLIDKNKKQYKKGEIIGKCDILLDGKIIGSVPIYCDRDIKKPGIFENFRNGVRGLFDNSI